MTRWRPAATRARARKLVAAARRLVALAPERLAAVLRGPAPRRAGWILIVALLALEGWGALRGHRLEASGTTLPGSSRLDRDQPVRFRPLPRAAR